MISTTLVAVAGGSTYHAFAMDLMRSARENFRPTAQVNTLILEGESGWPVGTLCRHRVLLESMPDTDFVYLIDADMIVSGPVGAEILPANFGITATLHPGYVGKSRAEFPYEDRPESAACIPPEKGIHYFCGGFFGGQRDAVVRLCTRVEQILAHDKAAGLPWPRWHDESALNAVLAWAKPDTVLPPSHCHPADSSYYEQTVWSETYPRLITALDKTAEQRVGR